MKTSTILSLSAAVALSSLLISVGCTAPVQTFDPNQEEDQTSKKSSDKDKDKDKDTKKNNSSSSSSSSSGSTPTPPAGQTTPPPGQVPPPGGTIPPPAGGEQGEACFVQCIAGNAAAKQIDDAFLACLDGGGNEQTCGQQADQACQQNQAACQLLDQCDQQCFGGEEGGQSNPECLISFTQRDRIRSPESIDDEPTILDT